MKDDQKVMDQLISLKGRVGMAMMTLPEGISGRAYFRKQFVYVDL